MGEPQCLLALLSEKELERLVWLRELLPAIKEGCVLADLKLPMQYFASMFGRRGGGWTRTGCVLFSHTFGTNIVV